jgi:hypothetical protein
MIGYVSDAVANALKGWDTLKDANVMPVFSTDGTTVVVNTPLPAVAIHVIGDDGEGNTYFGGGIRQYFELTLYVLLPLTNYTFSRDGGTQSKMLDISDDVIRCMEQSKEFDAIKQGHDFNIQFDRMDTERTYGSQGSLSVVVDVHKVVYKGSVAFDPKNADDKYDEVTGVNIKVKNEDI